MRNKWLNKVACVLGALLLAVSPMTVSATENATQDVLKETNPRIMVTGYEIVEGKIAQEENFTLSIEVTNMNKYADAYNVLVTYTSQTSNVRLADGEINQIFFEEIPAGESVTFTMDYQVLASYEADTLVMDYSIAYLDETGTGYNNVSTISPQIDKSCVMNINALSVANKAVVGSKALINVRYSGSGALEIESAKMLVEGNIVGGSKEVNLEVPAEGLQKSFDYYVNFQEEGTQELLISFAYTDENGNEYTVEGKSFSVEVSKYQTAVTNVTQEKTYEFVTGDNKYYIAVGCGCALVVVLLSAVIAILKMKNKKRG